MSPSQIPPDLTPPPDALRSDARRDAPAFHRNGAAIVEALTPLLGAASGAMLEIGSGTGQHAALFARSFPQLTFWPSDQDPSARASIDAWRVALGIETIRPAIALDAAAEAWPLGPAAPDHGFDALFCANVVHIAPWPVAQGLFRGAARWLAAEGALALYGPFRWSGRHISEGNEAFDRSLRARDASWGVRDVDDLDAEAARHGLTRRETMALPSNNHILVFARD
ncbi:MAG: DUF938 domain-containing protein [Pseudomonadota bacterium]